MEKHKKNIFYFLEGKKIFLLLLFFIPLAALSQNDSVVYSDTLGPETIEEPPPEVVAVDEPATYDYDDDYKQYFTYLWEIEDSFRVTQRKIPAEQSKKMQEDENFWYANSDIKKTE